MFKSLFVLLSGCALCGAAQAQSFFSVSNTNDSGTGSLRQAIINANAAASTPAAPHTISLAAIPGSGTATITLSTLLPTLIRPTTVLGPAARRIVLQPTSDRRGVFSGLNFSATADGSGVYFLTLKSFLHGVRTLADDFTLIGSTLDDSRLSGLYATDTLSLRVGGSDSTQRNVFTRNGWEGSNSQPRAGLVLECTVLNAQGECQANLGAEVLGNFFGLEADGSTVAGNNGYGIYLQSVRGVTLGGSAQAQANIVAYNGNSGLLLREHSRDVAAPLNAFSFNGAAGATASGRCAANFWANHCDGVTLLDSADVSFGEQQSQLPSSIAGNRAHGIAIRGGVGGVLIRSSIIGGVPGPGGVTLLPGNGGDGVLIDGASDNQLGFEQLPAAGNQIALNAGAGVRIRGATAQRNSVHPNSIHFNAGGGVLLQSGANGNLAAPVLNTTTPVAGTAAGSGPGVVELFADHGNQGLEHLASVLLVGNSFSVNRDLSGYAGQNLTAIQTRAGNSSTFSVPLMVPVPASESLLRVQIAGQGGVGSNPTGISCPSQCSATYFTGEPITLNPSPAPGWQFSHWSGDCSGSGSCQFAMTVSRLVTAHFVDGGPLPDVIHADSFE